MKVTKKLAIKAVLCGACYIPKVGQDVSEIPQKDLMWAEDNMPNLPKLRHPLWCMSKRGCGFGDYGDGDGYSGDGGASSGYGRCDGCGYSSSYGYGSGDGSGDGCSYGRCYGDGYGFGYGYGYGDGYGSDDMMEQLL